MSAAPVVAYTACRPAWSFHSRLSTNRPWLIIKAVECSWAFCRSLHPLQCTAKKWKQRLLNHACLDSRVKKSGQLLESSKMFERNVLSANFWQNKNDFCQISNISLWSLKLRDLLQFCKFLICCCIVYIWQMAWILTAPVGIDCIPTFLLIVFDWAGNQTWNACEVWLVPAAWNQWHVSATWNKSHRVVQSGHLRWLIMT